MALYLIHSDTGFRQRVRPMSGSGLNFRILRVQALGQGFSSMKLWGEKSVRGLVSGVRELRERQK